MRIFSLVLLTRVLIKLLPKTYDCLSFLAKKIHWVSATSSFFPLAIYCKYMLPFSGQIEKNVPPYIEVLAMENRPKPHPNKACSAIYNHIDLLLPDDRKLDGLKPRSGAFEKGLEPYSLWPLTTLFENSRHVLAQKIKVVST